MRIITCDRCGQIIQQGIKPWAFAICNSDTGEPYPGNPFKGWDFCLECKDEIIEFMKKQERDPVPETPEEKMLVSIAKSIEVPEKKFTSVAEKMARNNAKRKAIEKQADASNNAPKGIDKGKVVALRKAHWSIVKIADEMGCSQQRIGQILQEMKQKE